MSKPGERTIPIRRPVFPKRDPEDESYADRKRREAYEEALKEFRKKERK